MSNFATWMRNDLGRSGPEIMPGLFQAGGTLAIAAGDIISHDGTTWTILDADEAMAGDVAVAACDILSGDKAGYYPIIVPTFGDVFEYALDAADDLALGTELYYSAKNVVTDTTGSNVIGYAADDLALGIELYYSAKNVVTDTTGSNVIGYAADEQIYPPYQHFLSRGDIGDAGSTLKARSYIQFKFKQSVSYYAAYSA